MVSGRQDVFQWEHEPDSQMADASKREFYHEMLPDRGRQAANWLLRVMAQPVVLMTYLVTDFDASMVSGFLRRGSTSRTRPTPDGNRSVS